jgi:hypothetical protein
MFQAAPTTGRRDATSVKNSHHYKPKLTPFKYHEKFLIRSDPPMALLGIHPNM